MSNYVAQTPPPRVHTLMSELNEAAPECPAIDIEVPAPPSISPSPTHESESADAHADTTTSLPEEDPQPREDAPVEPLTAPPPSDWDSAVTRCLCGHNEVQDIFMIECDGCHVWQHGDCIGVTDQTVPDQYFCEQCDPRPDVYQGHRPDAKFHLADSLAAIIAAQVSTNNSRRKPASGRPAKRAAGARGAGRTKPRRTRDPAQPARRGGRHEPDGADGNEQGHHDDEEEDDAGEMTDSKQKPPKTPVHGAQQRVVAFGLSPTASPSVANNSAASLASQRLSREDREMQRIMQQFQQMEQQNLPPASNASPAVPPKVSLVTTTNARKRKEDDGKNKTPRATPRAATVGAAQRVVTPRPPSPPPPPPTAPPVSNFALDSVYAIDFFRRVAEHWPRGPKSDAVKVESESGESSTASDPFAWYTQLTSLASFQQLNGHQQQQCVQEWLDAGYQVPASFKHCMPPPSRQQQHQHANHPMFYRIRDHHHLLVAKDMPPRTPLQLGRARWLLSGFNPAVPSACVSLESVAAEPLRKRVRTLFGYQGNAAAAPCVTDDSLKPVPLAAATENKPSTPRTSRRLASVVDESEQDKGDEEHDDEHHDAVPNASNDVNMDDMVKPEHAEHTESHVDDAAASSNRDVEPEHHDGDHDENEHEDGAQEDERVDEQAQYHQEDQQEDHQEDQQDEQQDEQQDDQQDDRDEEAEGNESEESEDNEGDDVDPDESIAADEMQTDEAANDAQVPEQADQGEAMDQ